MEGFLSYRIGGLIFGGAYTWRGLFSEFYGFGVVTSGIIKFCSSPFVVSKGRQSRPSSRPQTIQFTLNEEQGYYEIGSQQDGNQIFVLSVTIGLASNLAKVQYIMFLFFSSL